MQGFRLCEEEARSMSRVRGQAAKRSRTTQGACPRRAGGRGAGCGCREEALCGSLGRRRPDGCFSGVWDNSTGAGDGVRAVLSGFQV